MKGLTLGFIGFFCLILSFCSLAQEPWIRIYGNGSVPYGRYLIETYDHGYIFMASKNNDSKAWILKTDINGYILWSKTISKQNESNVAETIEETHENGYIISGSTTDYSNGKDPFLLKMNSCAQPEWCKVLSSGGNNYGQAVKLLSDSGFLFLTRYPYSSHLNDRVQLTKFDSIGNIIWQQVYTNSDSLMFAEEGLDLIIMNNGYFLITGWCYYPHPGGTGGWRRPLLILSDNDGNLLWEIPWVYNGFFVGTARKSIVDTSGNIYSVGQNSLAYSAVPVLLKTIIDGQQLYYKNIIEENIYSGGSSAICWMTDTNILITAGWIEEPTSDPNIAYFKLDTLGNVIDSMNLPSLSSSIEHTIKTYNNKFVSVGTNYSGEIGMYAFKINENLEYDSIYTQPMIYDSLCPDSITTETFELDCDILVDVYEPFETKQRNILEIYPNPSSEIVNIRLPDYIITEQQTRNFEVTRIHYQYNGLMELKLFDMFGREIKKLSFSNQQEEIILNVSGLQEGLYLVVFYVGNNAYGSGKFIVRK